MSNLPKSITTLIFKFIFSNQILWLTETPEILWSINNDKSTGGTRGYPFLSALPSTHIILSCMIWKPEAKSKMCICECACVRCGCPFSEATLRKAVCSFENSSYPLSPVPHRRKAMGNVCQRTKEDAIYSALLLVQLRMKEANTERGSGCTQFKGIGIHPKVNWRKSQRGRRGS